jgi:hypothetical protein
MPEETMTAGGLPIVPAEPVPGPPTTLFRGSWCQDGGMVAKKADFAVLQSRAGMTVYLDRRAVELAALALGLAVVTPPVRLRTVWGRSSHGICPECTPLARAGRAVEIGR